jgi:hypothetical protein
MLNSDDRDREQQRPWFKRIGWKQLRNPKTIKFLIWIGITSYRVIKWIIDLFDLG